LLKSTGVPAAAPLLPTAAIVRPRLFRAALDAQGARTGYAEPSMTLRGVIRDGSVELNRDPRLPEGTLVDVVLVPVEKPRRRQAPIPGFGVLKGPKSKSSAAATARKLRKQVMRRGRG
jgi:hypothetical protein